MAKMTIDDKLGLDRFHADEKHSHIELNEDYADQAQIDLLLKACPAHLYRQDAPGGKVSFNHEGCLECGTCRVISGGKVVKSWNHPEGGMGVEYRMG